MRTLIKKIRSRKSEEKLSVVRFMKYFDRFSKKQQSKIAEQINEFTFSERWALLDKELPNQNISEDEVIYEVRAVRYGKKKSKNRT